MVGFEVEHLSFGKRRLWVDVDPVEVLHSSKETHKNRCV